MENVIAEEIKRQVNDRVQLAKEHGKNLSQFFDNLINIGSFASAEDIDIAMHSLKAAALEIKEKQASLHLPV